MNVSDVILLIWTEGAACNGGGSIASQFFSPTLLPIRDVPHPPDLPPVYVAMIFGKPIGPFVTRY